MKQCYQKGSATVHVFEPGKCVCNCGKSKGRIQHVEYAEKIAKRNKGRKNTVNPNG